MHNLASCDDIDHTLSLLCLAFDPVADMGVSSLWCFNLDTRRVTSPVSLSACILWRPPGRHKEHCLH